MKKVGERAGLPLSLLSRVTIWNVPSVSCIMIPVVPTLLGHFDRVTRRSESGLSFMLQLITLPVRMHPWKSAFSNFVGKVCL